MRLGLVRRDGFRRRRDQREAKSENEPPHLLPPEIGESEA
jgi:hypothetical protein